MPIDRNLLDRGRRRDDAEAGIYEEFAAERLGPGRSFALVAGPLRPQREVGVVICPSIGPEHGNVRRLEALVARRLAAAGFPTLRVRPDADPRQREIDLALRREEAEAAGELLRLESGVETVGFAGALFGGTVAALTADRFAAPLLVLIQPAYRGRQYARELLRREAIAQLLGGEQSEGGEDAADGERGPMHDLSTVGRTWVRGLGLTKAVFDAISAVRLVDDLQTFRGRSLLVEVSPDGSLSNGGQKLLDRLAALGGQTQLELVPDPLHAPLGEYHFRDAGLLRIDTRLQLDTAVAGAIAAWTIAGTEAAAASRVA